MVSVYSNNAYCSASILHSGTRCSSAFGVPIVSSSMGSITVSKGHPSPLALNPQPYLLTHPTDLANHSMSGCVPFSFVELRFSNHVQCTVLPYHELSSTRALAHYCPLLLTTSRVQQPNGTASILFHPCRVLAMYLPCTCHALAVYSTS